MLIPRYSYMVWWAELFLALAFFLATVALVLNWKPIPTLVAYGVNNLTGSDGSFGVFQFTVNSTTGLLTPNNPAFVASGNGPTEIAVDPTSKFAYVVNRQDNNLSMYTIDPSTGNLTLNTARANPMGTIAAGNEPFRALFDSSRTFLHVAPENCLSFRPYGEQRRNFDRSGINRQQLAGDFLRDAQIGYPRPRQWGYACDILNKNGDVRPGVIATPKNWPAVAASTASKKLSCPRTTNS